MGPPLEASAIIPELAGRPPIGRCALQSCGRRTQSASSRRLDKMRKWRRFTVDAPAGARRAAIGAAPSVNPGRIHASLQFQRRARGAPRRSAAAGRCRDARLARQRHVGDGNEPSRQGIHQHRRQGGGGSAHAARDPRELQGAVPAGRRYRRERDRADEPPRRAGRSRTTSTPANGRRSRSRKRRNTARSTSRRRRRTAASPTFRRSRRGSSRRTPPTSTCAPTRRSAASNTSGRPTRATYRSSPTCRRTSCRA